MNKILLIDGNSFFYRSFYASQHIPNYYTHQESKAVYTAIRSLKKFLSGQDYDYYRIFVAFDLGKKTFRHQQFAAYKINRRKTPDQLIEQIPIFEEFLKLIEIDILKDSLYEADDLIATLCCNGLAKGLAIDIFSNDTDLLQLIEANVNVFISQQGGSKLKIINQDNFTSQFHLHPSQMIDFKALTGDTSDNLPGVKGIGPITAIKLLQRFTTLENIYQNFAQIDSNLVDKLQSSYENAFFTKKMVTVFKNAPINVAFSKKKYNFYTPPLKEFYRRYRMHSLFKDHQQKSFRY